MKRIFKTVLLFSLGTIYGAVGHAKPTNHHSGKSLKIYPVEAINKTDPQEREGFQSCVVNQGQSPIFMAEGFDWGIKAKPKPGIMIRIDSKDAKALNQVSKQFLDKEIATCLDDNLLFMSTVKGELESGQFVISFHDAETTDKLIKILSLSENEDRPTQ